MMKRLLFISALCLLAPFAGAQSGTVQPNARITFDFTAAGRSDILDNRFLGCTTFHATYSNTGFSVLSWEMDAAPNSSGVAGTWAAFGSSIGSLPSGSSLPLTNTTGGQITGFKYTPFISVNLNSITGTGHVTGTLECWKPGGGQDASSSGGEPVVIASALPSGTNLIGKVGIDQTTPGTTNAVQETNLPSTVATGNGATTTSTVRVTLATDSAGPVFVSNLPSTVDTNSGVKSASTLRVVLATDQPQLTNKWLVTPDSVALPANQSVNVSQVGGVTTATGSGVVGTGVQRHVLATDVGIPLGSATVGQTSSNGAMAANDTAGIARVFAVAPFGFDGTNSVQFRTGATANLPSLTGSTLTANVAIDPCQSSAVAKQSAAVNISTATTTSIVAISGSTTIYACGWSFTVNGTTPTYQFEYGTGATCGTGTVVTTGVYAPTVGSFATYSPGMTAFPTIAAQRLCIVSGGTGPSIQGVVTYVQQ